MSEKENKDKFSEKSEVEKENLRLEQERRAVKNRSVAFNFAHGFESISYLPFFTVHITHPNLDKLTKISLELQKRLYQLLEEDTKQV